MILNIFIILQEFDLPLPIVKKKATKGRKKCFFFLHFDISSLFVDHFVLRLLHFLWLQLCRPGDTKDNGRGAVT